MLAHTLRRSCVIRITTGSIILACHGMLFLSNFFKSHGMADDFNSWVEDLESAEQPACNILNPEDCEACGS